MIDFIAEIQLAGKFEGLNRLFVKTPDDCVSLRGEEYELLLWGDPVGADDFVMNHPVTADQRQVAREIYGHFYFFLFSRKDKCIVAGNSLFSILPVYYCIANGRIALSNNAVDLGKHLGLSGVSRRFVLETMLFNYPLFNHSYIESVMLLPSNSFMAVSDGRFMIEKHTRIEEYFSSSPKLWRRSADQLSDQFLHDVRKYLPEERYVNSLTGGFDSRTLTAAGLYFRKDFTCSGFGASGSKDIVIAEKVAAGMSLPWRKIVLDDDFVKNDSLRYGYQFIRNSSGSATFVRGHYLHAAALLANDSRYLVTGNFGSELFRAAHVRGVVFSPNLITLFGSRDLQEAVSGIEQSREFSAVIKDEYASAWAELKHDLTSLPRFNPEYRHLTLNQQFYVTVFEEVFRKYFGAEMVSQFGVIRNRTPYLDFNFNRALLQTGLSGVYSGFFEHNPLKRYKGQVLYSHIIRKAWPALGRMMSDKGYCPEDLLTLSGQMKVLRGYVAKKKNQTAASDPYSVNRSFAHNAGFFRQLSSGNTLFNSECFSDSRFAVPDGVLLKALSLTWLKRSLEEGSWMTSPQAYKAEKIQ